MASEDKSKQIQQDKIEPSRSSNVRALSMGRSLHFFNGGSIRSSEFDVRGGGLSVEVNNGLSEEEFSDKVTVAI